MTSRAGHLSTRLQWVLQAVGDGRISHDRIYGDLAPFDLDGHPVDWTITVLAARGLVAFDPLLPSPPHLTPRDLATLTGQAPRGGSHRRTSHRGNHPPLPEKAAMAHPTPQPGLANPGRDPGAVDAHTQLAVDTVIDDLTYAYDGTFDRDTVTRVVTEIQARLEATATIKAYLPVLVARQARDRLAAAAVAAGKPATPVPELLFVCIHNAGRSQMAAALASHLTAGRIHARSAGSAPAETVDPVVLQALAERGITLTGAQPQRLTDDAVHAADVIITMGCGDACPFYPGKRYLDWDIPDPHNQPLDVVRDIRDLIQARVTDLLRDLKI